MSIAPGPPPPDEPENPYRPPRDEPSHRPTLRIGTLMLLIALVAVNLAIWVANPWVGALVTVASGIGLVRAMVATRSDGSPRSGGAKAVAFFVTFVTVLLSPIAAFFAFFGTCIGASSVCGNNAAGAAIIASVAAAVLAVVILALIARAIDRGLRDIPQEPPKREPEW